MQFLIIQDKVHILSELSAALSSMGLSAQFLWSFILMVVVGKVCSASFLLDPVWGMSSELHLVVAAIFFVEGDKAKLDDFLSRLSSSRISSFMSSSKVL